MSLSLEQNFVRGPPLLNESKCMHLFTKTLKAFCDKHVTFLNDKHPNVPTDIRGLLKYCGIERRSTGIKMLIVLINEYKNNK